MEEREIHLRDYLRVIDKRRYTVYTFFIVVFTVVLIGTFSATPVYMASTKVLIEKRESVPLMTNYGYMPYDPDFYETQYQIIKSIPVARRVVRMLDLEKTYGSLMKGPDSGFSMVDAVSGWFRDLSSVIFGKKEEKPSGSEEESREDMLAKTISAGISVDPVKNSKIVTVNYISTNPGLAKSVANTVAKAYIDELLDLNMGSTKHTLQWMTKKAEEEKKRLDDSERALQKYIKSQDLVTIQNKMAIVPEQISQLNSQLVKAQTRREEMETLYNQVREVSSHPGKAETVSAIADDPTLQSLRQQILEAEQKIMDLSQKYGKKHPLMIRAREDLNVLKEKKEQEIKRVIDSIKNEYDLARSNENNLRRMLSEAKGHAINLNEKFIEYDMINREVETNRQLYEALIKRIKEQNITEQIQTANVMIVEKARTPASPVKPRKTLNVLLGIIVGLFGGFGMAFFVEYLDQSVKSPEEVEARFGVPVFGLIPLFPSNDRPIENAVVDNPTSTFAENYKAIRTCLLLSSAEKPPKHILVTSAGPEEGKTVTSINLAAAIAQSAYRVLLVDADLRKPRVHKVFRMDNSKGLSTYLAGASDMDIIRVGPLPNLQVIPSGPVPPNPSELLGSGKLVEMMGLLGREYDIVIWDSPPILTVVDSLILGKVLDGSIVVTRAGKTTYEVLGRSLKSLADLNANVFGVVINAFDLKKNKYYYSRYHNYYYAADGENRYDIM
ncbi:MAG: polysaccharide biosynthesis tyrosine autokinase [Candidatus Sulfobium sp.]|jgi:succinoglycan biosynthesis transport protein ExoP